ncbi:MAG TPA: phosphodiesterase, partial [Gammaproteobacteria bacterium]
VPSTPRSRPRPARLPRRPGRPLRLTQFSDLHLLGDPGQTLRGVDTAATFAETLDAAATAIRRADLLLLTGDLAEHGEAAAYARLRRQLAGLAARPFAVPGNHDDAARLARCLPASGARRVAALALGNWRLLLLDSALPGHSAGRLDRRQLDWLRRQLRRQRRQPTLVILHHPPLPLGTRWLDAIALQNGSLLRRLLAPFAQVRGVVCGHVHQAHDRRRGGVRYLATPSTCVQFVPGTPRPRVDDLAPGWRELRLFPSGRLRSEVRRAGR